MSFEDCLDKAGIKKSDLIEWKKAKIIKSRGRDEQGFEIEDKYKGYILITKDRFVFVKDKGLITGLKIMYDVPLKKITNINKVSLIHRIKVSANISDKDSGFFKKLFSGRSAMFDVGGAGDFIKKVKSLLD
jgi:hypothetical protein